MSEQARSTAYLTPCFESPSVTIYQADSRDAWQHLDVHAAAWPGSAANVGDTFAGRANGGASVGPSYRRDRADVIPKRVNATGTAPYKSLLMIPERVALALIDRGWILRNKVVWAKPNGMPSSATDRLATRWECLFHFVRQPHYYYDLDAIREPFAESSIKRGAPHRAPTVKALDKAHAAGLTDDHLDAIRAVGITDTGQAKAVQSGTGRNTEEIKRLAEEAMAPRRRDRPVRRIRHHRGDGPQARSARRLSRTER